MAKRANKGRRNPYRPGQVLREPVFSDPGHNRRRVFAFVATIIPTFFAAWVAIFGAHLYFVDKLQAPPRAALPATAFAEQADAEGSTAFGVVPQDVCETSPYPTIVPRSNDPNLRVLPTETVFAFLPYLPETTYASLETGINAIDVLMPEWFRVTNAREGVVMLNREAEHQVFLKQVIDRSFPRVRVVPVVRVIHGSLPANGADWQTLVRLAEDLANLAVARGYYGLAIMPAGIESSEMQAFANLAALLDVALNAHGLRSHLLASVDSPLLNKHVLIEAMDLVIVKTFRDPWVGNPPEPLAANDWFNARARWAIETVGREKLVVMLGSFAVDWSRQAAAPERIPVADAFRRLAANGGKFDYPAEAGNLRMRYETPSGVAHEIWSLDAASLYNQLAVLSELELRQVGLWSLGFEDPSVWPILSVQLLNPENAARFIAEVDFSDFVGYEGSGPFQRLTRSAVIGKRLVSIDPESGLVSNQGFAPLPEPWGILRYGQPAPDTVAITFDDGPDPTHTAAILDVLSERDVTATFFVVGAHVLQSPEIVRRMLTEGHLVGSHTFLHPEIGDKPLLRTLFEVNALQRLLEVVTGRGTLLFRTPYGRSEGPMTGEDAAPMEVLENAGYVIVGSDVVPPDWLALDAQEIVDFVMKTLERSGGNVIVLHDGGGDRQATVDALGPLIDRLRADGYEIADLAAMLGISRDQAMPVAGGSFALLDQVSFGLLRAMSGLLIGLFWVLIAVGVVRSLVIVMLALGRRRHDPKAGIFAPPVTVVIPAFNEELTIIRCIDSVFASDYPSIRVIVVDDGSTDHTFERVRAHAARVPGILVFHEPNKGKPVALDAAYGSYGGIDTEIVVAIDADSMLARNAITLLSQHFADPAVGAVAGRVRVGNRRGLLTKLQALEYLTAQSIDRRAFERLNSILVVPGAIGAWRTRAVREAGLYSADTVTEDADLTVSVIRAGYRVVYEDRAYAVTEAPETVRQFLGQRLRWSFGMLQTAFKHIAGAARQRLFVGWVALPDLLVVGFGFSILAPLVDLILIGTLLDLAVDSVVGRPERVVDVRPHLLFGYALLPLMDVVLILVAMRLDRSESLGLLLLFPVQRFFYRQLMYFSALRAMFRAATGNMTRWGHLKRTGHARLSKSN